MDFDARIKHGFGHMSPDAGFHRFEKTARLTQMLSTIDLVPTLLELLALQIPADLPGESWVPAMRHPGSIPGTEKIFFHEKPYGVEYTGIRTEQWKFVHKNEKGSESSLLIDLVNDPEENHSADSLSKAKEMGAFLEEWKKENLFITQTREMTEVMRQALKEGGVSAQMNNMESYPSPRKVLVLLLLMDVGVGALHILFSSDLEIGAFFNLAHEENLPTWYSSFQFLLVAGAAVFCYVLEKTVSSQKTAGWGWLVVALCMLGLAIDETLQIHEVLIDQVMSGNAGNNLRHFFGATRDTDSLLWTVVFAPILILAATALILFYYSRLRSNRSLFRLSLLPLCLLVLSAGLEFMEAKTLSSFAQDPMVRYRQFIFIEEMAELVAASLFVWIHYQYAMWWRVSHYQFSDAGEL